MNRSKPFSAKQKKKQLQEKRNKKKETGPRFGGRHGAAYGGDDETQEKENEPQESRTGTTMKDVLKVNQQPGDKQKMFDANRYRLHFFQEDRANIEAKKKRARQPYRQLPEHEMEVDFDADLETAMDIPIRPAWYYSQSKQQVEANEEKYFREYVEKLLGDHGEEGLSYFELNLETWRQLWRVLEMSDVFLVIADIRYPAIHFPPALYRHITHDLKKSAIVVLNKVDLVPPPLVVAWQQYFKQRFPLVDVVCFSSFPKSKEELGVMTGALGKTVFKKRRRGTYKAMGPKELLQLCQNIVGAKVDLTSWEKKIEADQTEIADDDGSDSDEDDDDDQDVETIDDAAVGDEASRLGEGLTRHDAFSNGVLTIGCVGFPNVGKSSVINGLMGKKVVSVSKTPGHTKHFQTIFLTPTVRLCDCPGLVFPSKIDKNLQILGGIFPIAQVREPFSVVGYLAQRLDLPKLLKLKPVDEDADPRNHKWTPLDVCESWAQQRGFYTAKAARLDGNRGANNLLRLAVEGRLCLCLFPPGYTKKKELWSEHGDTEAFVELQSKYTKRTQVSADSEEEVAESCSDEEENEESDEEREPHKGRGGNLVSLNPFALLGDDD
ncbi:guanine nucleotide-binding protein-like 1 [Dreissena polymorpha]|uniref:Guanine nucleotide-binding protein-like 1 n=1 Tax=Dreissena polymorpha TaxID=45954 RepID=A0A9D4JCN1_DREPO|nr:guanine nucleotide-binding protein-like 1 [Dreissena polymorpha]KAH3803047.1 hypothetical protein DPMN_156746 [Dreissena polymorpha]